MNRTLASLCPAMCMDRLLDQHFRHGVRQACLPSDGAKLKVYIILPAS